MYPVRPALKHNVHIYLNGKWHLAEEGSASGGRPRCAISKYKRLIARRFLFSQCTYMGTIRFYVHA